jgi:ribosome biogenesis GTPase A
MQAMLRSMKKDFEKKYEKKRIQAPPIRLMVLGLPNTGKSSFINYLIGNKKLNTGSKPGRTIYSQWVKLPYQMEILDTPGILPALVPDKDAFHKLYATRALQQNSEIESLSLQYLFENCPLFKKAVLRKYNLENMNFWAMLKKIRSQYHTEQDLHQKIFADFHKGLMSEVTLDCDLSD